MMPTPMDFFNFARLAQFRSRRSLTLPDPERDLHRRSKRQVHRGYPSDATLHEVLPKLDVRSNHQYIPLGQHATLKCTDYGGGVEESGPYRKNFKWSHSNGNPVTSPEVSYKNTL